MKPFDLLAELERIADDLSVGCHQTARVRVDELRSKVRRGVGEVDVTPTASPEGEVVPAEVLGFQFLQAAIAREEGQ